MKTTTQTAPAAVAPTAPARVLPTDSQLLDLAKSAPRHLDVLRVTARTADGKRYARVVVKCGCGAEREVASQDLFQVKGCFSCQTRAARKARKSHQKERVSDLKATIAALEAKLNAK